MKRGFDPRTVIRPCLARRGDMVFYIGQWLPIVDVLPAVEKGQTWGAFFRGPRGPKYGDPSGYAAAVTRVKETLYAYNHRPENHCYLFGVLIETFAPKSREMLGWIPDISNCTIHRGPPTEGARCDPYSVGPEGETQGYLDGETPHRWL